jgi:hypothetical protein
MNVLGFHLLEGIARTESEQHPSGLAELRDQGDCRGSGRRGGAAVRIAASIALGTTATRGALAGAAALVDIGLTAAGGLARRAADQRNTGPTTGKTAASTTAAPAAAEEQQRDQ